MFKSLEGSRAQEMSIVMKLDVEFFFILILHFIKIHLILAVNYQLKKAIENDDGIMIQCVRCNANEKLKKKKNQES